MATINQLRQERLAFFRELKRLYRAVDTAQEAVERQIQGVLDRRRNVPEDKDFLETIQLGYNLLRALETYEAQLLEGSYIFNVEVDLRGF